MCAPNRRSGRTPTLLPNNNDDNLWLAQNVYLAIIRLAASRPNLPIAPLHRGVRVRLVRCASREREKKTGKVPAITLRRCYQVGVARRAEPPGTIIIVMGREQHNERGPARTIAPAAARLYKTTRLNLHASLSGTGARRFEYD
jgi:hypothetical protein